MTPIRSLRLTFATSLTLGASLLAGCGGGAGLRSAATPLAAARPVAPPTYRAGGPWRYQYDRIDSLEYTLPNGARQLQVIERHLKLRWESTRSGDTLRFRVALDSVDLIAPGISGRALEDSARGSVISALFSPDGRVSGIAGTPDNTVTHAFLTEVPWLLPAIPASLALGAVRADTLDGTVRFGVVDLTQRIVRQTVVATTPGEFDLSGIISRDGVSPSLRLTGGGARTGHAALSGDGSLRTAAGRDSVAMDASVEATGQSVQVIQIGNYSLTPIP